MHVPLKSSMLMEEHLFCYQLCESDSAQTFCHRLKHKHVSTSNDYPKSPCVAAASMSCPDAKSALQLLTEVQQAAIWHGCPIREVLPMHLKSVIACGGSFPCCNCDDSVLIIIKSTCMTGFRPNEGLFLSDHKIGAWWEMQRCWGMRTPVCVCVLC